MLDKHFEHNGRSERERPINPADQLGSMSDREVPLSAPTTATADIINRWLDGEIPEPVGMKGEGARAVDFWKHVGEETERRSRMVTPAHVSANIMAALPPLAPQTGVAPWHRREVKVSTIMLTLGALGVFILGAFVARAMLTP
jgi:hypothetical protein